MRRTDADERTSVPASSSLTADGRRLTAPGGYLGTTLTELRASLRRALRVLRQVIGAPDYELYLEHHARAHAGTPPLARREFYAEFVSWRFGSGATRCC